MAIYEKSLCTSVANYEPLYNFLKEYVEGVYFDEIVLDIENKEIVCYLNTIKRFVFSWGQSTSQQAIRPYNPTPNYYMLLGSSTTSTGGRQYFDKGYVCSNGILLENRSIYGTTKYIGMSLIFTKSEDGDTCIIYTNSGSLAFESIQKNTQTALNNPYSASCSYVAIDGKTTIDNSSTNMTTWSYPNVSKVCLAPMLTTDVNTTIIPHCYLVSTRGFTDVCAIEVCGHTYLTNSVFAIQDE